DVGEGKNSGSITLAGSGALPSWLDASAVALFLSVSRPTAKKWMEANYTGLYRLAGCRNFDGKQGDKIVKVRKAPLKSVAAVKTLLDQARLAKNGATSALVEEPEPQNHRN